MHKSKKNWVLLGIVVLAVFLIIKMAIELNYVQNKIADKDKSYCFGSREEFCTTEYNPVCGWYDSSKIQCVKYPCAQTYSNGCSACADKNIEYYTKGECPKIYLE